MNPENLKQELSPMDPPEAYHPPASIAVEYGEMHPFLRSLIDEHKAIKTALDKFENVLSRIKEEGITREVNESLGGFFQFFNDEFISHDKKEEKYLFPALETKLIKKGEHSKGSVITTATDVMEDDHVRIIQMASIIFNFFGLASRLTDLSSRNIVLDAALSQADEFIESMRLHIFREDTIVFSLAHQLIGAAELDQLQISQKRSNFGEKL